MTLDRRLLALGLLLSVFAPAASAINVCTDSQGKTVYQQQPCLSVEPRLENSPIAASTMTAALASDTVKRYRASLANRDATTAARFLAPKFKLTLEGHNGTSHLDRDQFAQLMTRVLDAATSFKSSGRCGPAVLDGDGVATVSCEVKESSTVIKRTFEGTSTDTYRIGIVNGVAKLLALSSIEHKT